MIIYWIYSWFLGLLLGLVFRVIDRLYTSWFS